MRNLQESLRPPLKARRNSSFTEELTRGSQQIEIYFPRFPGTN